ncbi:hypothetical protein WA1_17510 [Scytonema hofmannii PCC 7110]|uniref:DUF3616 domain-containing protein n=1 Tax=Scytonema hofmannii PCC 7110 TaxID=128403 RepID=A0A139XB30_9CYAN|nr:DUF3616 domain-containing protein [Scytonema hofmannii]KYC41822.1 hypothetical protein WA1_17510 [Scytonema hofmannii PCC 7110]
MPNTSSLIHQVLLKFADNFTTHRDDLSAVLFTTEKHLWLGSDETSTIERLSLSENHQFAEHKQFHVANFINLPAPEEEEIDIEGLAHNEHYLWIVGSHSYKRKNSKPDKSDEKNIKRLAKVESEPNRYFIGRIPLINGELFSSCPHPTNSDIVLSAAKLEVTDKGNLLMEALANDPHLGCFVQAEIPGKDNGFDIEGITIHQNRIFLGLRGPVLRGWAMMLEIALEDSSPGLMKLGKIGEEGQRYKKYFLALNGLGIRDVFFNGQEFLFLAGPTMDLDGPVQVYSLKNDGNLQGNILHYPKLVLDIPYGNKDDHAEGITPYQDITGVPSLLVVYDSPSNKRLVGDTGVMADVFKLETTG